MQSLYFKTFNFIDNSKPNHIGLYFSLLLHLSILLFAIGLPDFFKPKKIPMPNVIPIEILNVSDVTSLKPKKDDPDIDKKEIKEIKQKKFTSSDNTEIQKIDLLEKPNKKIVANENFQQSNTLTTKNESKKISLKEKKINSLNEDKVIKIDKSEKIVTKKIKPKLKPKPVEKAESNSDIQKIDNNPKPLIKKNDDKKLLDKPKPIEKPQPDFNLSTMLKDLRNEDISNNNQKNSKKEIDLDQNEKNEVESNLEVSISEMDLVLQQLRSCFNPRAGTQIVGDEMVKISAKIDRNANVRKDTVQIIATNISKNNPYYEAITESAVATLYNPICSKLKLPLDKYESWKDLKITIDYSWIKN